MKNKALVTGLAALLASASVPASARDTVSIVGSSTVYPFSTVVAERFGRTSKFATPKVESTGSGGGMKLFCSGIGTEHPDITNSSRRMKKGEFETCQKNGVTDIVEVKLGFDGIVFANSVKTKAFDLTLREVFLALGKDVPNPDGSETLIANPYKKWSDINPALPNEKIEVMGPPPTSGTRDSFNELAIEGGCKTFPWVAAMKKSNGEKYKAICRAIREDGHYIEAGENDNLIVQKLEASPKMLGVFGFSFLDQNRGKVHGVKIDGVAPGFDEIASGAYPVSRSMYVYFKKAHIGVVPGIKGYLFELTSEKTWGDEGYLAEKGLIPTLKAERDQIAKAARNLVTMTGKEL